MNTVSWLFLHMLLLFYLSLFLLVAIKENIENEHVIYSLTTIFRTLKSSLEEPRGSVSLIAQEELVQPRPVEAQKSFLPLSPFDSSNRSVR